MTRRRGPTISRRGLLVGAVGAAGAVAGAPAVLRALRTLDQPRARVGAYRVPAYDADLVGTIVRGIRDFPQVVERARSGPVILKPNLVEYAVDRPINTDARFLAAVIEAFRAVGAPSIAVAEGPGHRRDTELIVEKTGLRTVLEGLDVPFVDLNVDVTRPIRLAHDYTGLGSLRIGRTVLDAGLLVSVAKLKTHHWTGATLTLKNLFGTVPGAVYGWPKNLLHWVGIERSIVDLWDTLRPGFGIVDGVVGMEGDGPIMGSAVSSGVVFLGDNLPAVDATAARFMGLRPEAIPHLRVAAELGGTLAEGRIEVFGDAPDPMDFAVVERFAFLKA